MYRVIRLVYNNTERERESSLSGSMIQNDNDDKHTDPSDSFQSYRCRCSRRPSCCLFDSRSASCFGVNFNECYLGLCCFEWKKWRNKKICHLVTNRIDTSSVARPRRSVIKVVIFFKKTLKKCYDLFSRHEYLIFFYKNDLYSWRFSR